MAVIPAYWWLILKLELFSTLIFILGDSVHRPSGFTLIEMMLVVVIIAIMTTIVTLSVSSPSFGRFLASAEQFSSTLSILSDEAIYSGDVIACKLTATSISCDRYRQGDNDWTEIDMRKVVSWGWPKGLKILKVMVNGVPLKDNEPIRFFPSGDNASLSIEVGNEEYTAWIDSDLIGRYKVSS